jgi:hypothetical protein
VADQRGTLAQLTGELGSAFAAIGELLEVNKFSDLLLELGLDNPPGLGGDSQFIQKLNDASAQCIALDEATADLLDKSESEDLNGILDAIAKIIEAITKLIVDLEAVATDLKRATAGLADAGTIAAFAGEMVERLLEAAVVRYLEEAHPVIESLLGLLTIIEVTPLPGLAQPPDIGSGDAALVVADADPAVPFARRRLFWDRVAKLFQDPLGLLLAAYKWGDPSFDGKRLFLSLSELFDALGPFSLYDELGASADAELSFLSLSFGVTRDKTIIPPGLEGALYVDLEDSAELKLAQIDDSWSLVLKLSGSFGAGLAISLLPPEKLEFVPPSGDLQGGISLTFIGESPDPTLPLILFGEAGGSRLQAKRVQAGLIANLEWDGSSKAGADVGFEAKFVEGKLIVDTSKSDGFMQKILPGDGISAEFDFDLGWTAQRGFYFSGSSALEVRLPAHIELGPVSIEALTIGVKLDGGKIPVSVGADIKAALGPIVAVVENLGVTATFSFPPGNSGNLGPLQFDLGFKPPNGVGLSIDTGVIKGGGFLHLDFDKGEYFGALELSFQDVITLKAIGIINTKMPDGSKGFALLILVTAEFTPIQLGFGFTLIGVGGLLALNRSLDTEALRTGVRTGAVNSILFPQDIVANISKIISDLKTIFPIVEGHFVIGPMGKIGWGTPTLISLEIGVILDIPQPMFVILGVLRCVLPSEDLPILQLQVNFAGGVDFGQGLIWFDASLFDSHLLLFTLTGDMALRIGWGAQAIFVLSVGGFHPAFTEIPPDLRSMKRMSISLLSGDNPRLTVQTYFAITSNSVQSGARVELYAAACGFNIYGYLGYDLLIQFNPFHFVAAIAAGLALRSGTDVLFGISVSGELSGPQPWRVRGSASFSILFFDVSIDFDVTWGDDAPSQIEQTVDVLPLVKTALEDDRNWTATFPANTHATVTLKQITPAPASVVLHPFGVLAVSQKVVPLGVEINKFGNQKPSGATKFDLTFGGGGTDEVREEFAMANFLRMSDSDKLARKSFEQLRSGLRFATGDSSQYGANVQKEVNYELSYVHKKKGLTIKGGLISMLNSVFSMFSKGGSIAKNSYSVSKYAGATPPAKVETTEPGYMVVNASDLSLHAPDMMAKSSTEAYMLQDQLLAGDPSLRGKVMVVASHELN